MWISANIGNESSFFEKEFPYKALSISQNKQILYSSIDDIYKELASLYDEAKERGFNLGEALYRQSLFFVDANILVNSNAQNLIKKYTFCKKFNIPPYKSLQETPAKFIDDFMIIDEEVNAIKDNKNNEVNNG